MTIVEIFAIDKAERTVSGLVYCCVDAFGPDMQGDAVKDAGVLKEAEIEFMERVASGKPCFDIEHKGKPYTFDVVESMVTEEELTKDGTTIPAGCWYLKLRVPEDVFKRIESGELTGFSMKGEGQGRHEN